MYKGGAHKDEWLSIKRFLYLIIITSIKLITHVMKFDRTPERLYKVYKSSRMTFIRLHNCAFAEIAFAIKSLGGHGSALSSSIMKVFYSASEHWTMRFEFLANKEANSSSYNSLNIAAIAISTIT